MTSCSTGIHQNIRRSSIRTREISPKKMKEARRIIWPMLGSVNIFSAR